MYLLVALPFGPGRACVVHGRRLAARTAQKVRESDCRAEVLYLRSFVDDRRVGGVVEGFTRTIEEGLGRAFNPLGPFMCIDDPRENLPAVGAAREQVPDDKWKERAAKRMLEAKLVAVLVGGGEGLAWEVRELLHLQDPQRVVLLIARKETYERFRIAVGGLFPQPLPIWPRASWGPRGSVQGLIEFARDWTPILKPFPTWRLVTGGVPRCLELALRDVYSRMGVSPRVPVVTLHEVTIVILIAAFAAAAILVGWLELRS